jgi:predicted DNA-binding transcriptional regulator AlpA
VIASVLTLDNRGMSLPGSVRRVETGDLHVEEARVLYEFTFVVEGVNAEDDEAVSVLAEHLDATLARGAGVNLLLITSEGVDAIHAALNAIASAESLVPKIRFLHLDRDLVGISEIAKRTGHSRQNVAQWVTGERRAADSAPFPKVEGVVGRARIWLWSEVNAWLRLLGLGDDITPPRRNEIANIDFFILHKEAISRNRPRTDLVWPPVFAGFLDEGTAHVGASRWVVMTSSLSAGTGEYMRAIVDPGNSSFTLSVSP